VQRHNVDVFKWLLDPQIFGVFEPFGLFCDMSFSGDGVPAVRPLEAILAMGNPSELGILFCILQVFPICVINLVDVKSLYLLGLVGVLVMLLKNFDGFIELGEGPLIDI
jgi:hypothetical protein